MVGLGISGMSAVDFLYGKGAVITINDIKTEEQLTAKLEQLSGKYHRAMLGVEPDKCFDGIELIVISPGVDFNNPWVKKAQELGIETDTPEQIASYKKEWNE